MDDIKINGLVASVIFGWVGGMATIGPIGENQMWGLVGGLIGAGFMVYKYFRDRKEKSDHKTNVK